jgi:hypothetical protein
MLRKDLKKSAISSTRVESKNKTNSNKSSSIESVENNKNY